ncbi:hypothetical protein DPMN_168003 [Dreissena polymorpha]|uniref:Uncharacterized protein n=1 Tax=Dreissena polymorpha TaxID=45954 RepID=A0A9D4IYW3_DREPO|nr:hypothetical protein DPMN_168003 [Dreissena polymorpha]
MCVSHTGRNQESIGGGSSLQPDDEHHQGPPTSKCLSKEVSFRISDNGLHTKYKSRQSKNVFAMCGQRRSSPACESPQTDQEPPRPLMRYKTLCNFIADSTAEDQTT